MKDQSLAAETVNRKTSTFPQIDPLKLLQSIVDVIFVVDEKGYFQYVSPSCYELLGYEEVEIVGKSFINFIHPDDIENTVKIVKEATHNCRTSNFENRYIHKDGSIIPIIWSGRWDNNERMLYCSARNGSEKYEVEHRLQKAQKMARVANYEFDIINNIYTYTSDTLFEIFGLEKSNYPQFTSEVFWSLVHPEDLPFVRQTILQPDFIINSQHEYRIIRPDGKIAYISRHREIIRDEEGNPIKTIGTLQDITIQKTGELAVQQSEIRFRSLVENGNDLVGIIDLTGKYIFVGMNVKVHLGYDAQEMIGKNAFDYIHPDDLRGIAEVLNQIQYAQSLNVAPFRFINNKGEYRWVETTVSNHLQNPAIGGLVTNSKDITEKKLKEDALRLSEQRFKALVHNGSDLIVIIDDKGSFNYISDNVKSVLGYIPEEMIGKNALEFIHPEDIEKASFEIQTLLHGNRTPKGVQHRFKDKNGKWIWMESKGSNHLNNETLKGILVNSRNIDDRVKLQERLNQELLNKQKEITSAVIKAQEAERSQLGLELHDNVNQILTTVKLYNEMYLTGYLHDKELLVKSTQYTQDCINEIRNISKRLSAPTLGKISIKDSIKELINSINITKRLEIIYLPHGIDNYTASEDLHTSLYRIVQESLNNILKYSGARIASVEIIRQEGSLVLKICDNGKGFDTSTKRGGIGITNMKTRAENLNASFRLTSSPGRGCQIEICFPIYEETDTEN
ncbi:PAS domain S-box protein [Flavisolibacter ginsengisoli]|jgi:PAS domain S-box-containing protein|uniref:histidine kinase n=1 Tax=Flavisolibacter ginsengisoli DSM 18119 TaxID=1121884 RepID=A0A1M4SMI2_9BACT|nr:PAS domain S-box protein [Flavisolibacter ginsengisoli]SHE33474.1 PAS domain S-box-containing protein [Flavisolibacter ginsengisoli DSM 18119]